MTAATTHGTVYALLDPRTQQVRYIGATKKPLETRLAGHLRSPSGSWPMIQWLAELSREGLRPQIVPVLENVPLADLGKAEHEHITQRFAAGENLFNKPVGSPRYSPWRERLPLTPEQDELLRQLEIAAADYAKATTRAATRKARAAREQLAWAALDAEILPPTIARQLRVGTEWVYVRARSPRRPRSQNAEEQR